MYPNLPAPPPAPQLGSLLDDAKGLLNKTGSDISVSGKDILNVITDPIQQRINQKLDSLVSAIRVKLATEKGVSLNEITDLEISEYLMQMPLRSTNDTVTVVADQSTKIIAGSIVIGFSIVALAIFFSRK